MANKETTRVTITIPVDIYEKIKKLANENDRTISNQMTNMLKQILEKQSST